MLDLFVFLTSTCTHNTATANAVPGSGLSLASGLGQGVRFLADYLSSQPSSGVPTSLENFAGGSSESSPIPPVFPGAAVNRHQSHQLRARSDFVCWLQDFGLALFDDIQRIAVC